MPSLFSGNKYLQTVALLLAAVGIVEIVVGGLASSVVSDSFGAGWAVAMGAWWSGVVCLIAGVCGLMQGPPWMHATGYVLSVLAFVAAISGLVLDGLGYAIAKPLDTCLNQQGEYFGNQGSEYKSAALSCYIGNSQYDCNCINLNNDDTCYVYDLEHDTQNCQQILGYYTSMLRKSVTTLWVLTAVSTIYSVWFCSVQMCSASCEASSCSVMPGCCTVSGEPDGGAVAGGAAGGVGGQHVGNPMASPVPRVLQPGEQVVYIDGVPTVVKDPQPYSYNGRQFEQQQVAYAVPAPASAPPGV